MRKPFFSIVIPTLKPSIKSLIRCLQGIAEQDYDDYEVIVIDCISPQSNQVKAICKMFRHTFYLSDQNQRGVYTAMNQSLPETNGAWILFLGHDDRLNGPNVLRRSKELIIRYSLIFWRQAYYGSVMVQGDAGWANDGATYDKEFCFAKLIDKNICHQAIFYRGSYARNKFRQYSEQYRITADWEYNIHAWTSGGMGYLPIIVSIFTGGGLSSSSVFDGFSGRQSLTWNYWKVRRPQFLVCLTLVYCRLASKEVKLNSRFIRWARDRITNIGILIDRSKK